MSRVIVVVVAVATAFAVGAVAQPSNEVVDPSSTPMPTDADAEMMHNVDLGAPGQMYESNYTEANNCPACAAYALAIRRLNWDTPPREGARDRRSGLVHDERVSEISFDALGAVVDHYVYVPTRKRYAPLVYAKAANVLNDAELALAEKHVEMQGDQKLMDYIHFHLAEEAGDEGEGLAGRDLLKGKLESDFRWPPGTGACDPAMGPECLNRLNTFVLLKDRARDLQERITYVRSMCKGACGKRHVQTAIPLEHDDLGVPSVVEMAEQTARAVEQREAEEELAREKARFPPENAHNQKKKDGSNTGDGAKTEESHQQSVYDEATHGRHDPSKPPMDAREREAADLAKHEEQRRVRRAASEGAD
eukprot:CAMPEP_0174870366 /NCGR_PEP_ID=MMETSP1114-20130205/69613_1 /TAXON_ID=312471 /ORGANISM="Neobodo designis, Strain CCAP 1951/1" /LENGTH=362 /DNA_ID=CAMNT_0016105635 /DNA_START=36 /DNA_END=1121 /DNA_ORIENTATION=+